MKAACNPDGTLTITATPYETATLIGRAAGLDLDAVQTELDDEVRAAWYAADCPPFEHLRPVSA